MPREPTRSRLSREQRIERAFTYFAKGYRNVDVQRLLHVSRDTVQRYRKRYEQSIQKDVSENPRILTDVLGNTVRVLQEIDLVKADAWKRLDNRKHHPHVCNECGCHIPLSTNEAVALDKVILEATQQRMRLFGLLGIKQEYFIQVQRMALFQERILQFLNTEVCEDDRRKLDHYIGELTSGGEYLDAQSTELSIGA